MAIQKTSRVPSAAVNGKHGHSLISDAKFRQLYELTLRLRASAAGHEAVLAAIAVDLRSDDVFVAEPSADRMLRRFLPEALDSSHSTDFMERAIAAVGAAAADRMRRNGRITVLFAPGTDAEDMLREVRLLASAAKLPVLFVDGVCPPSGNGKAGKSANEPDENQLPAIPADARDVVALYRVAHESIARARTGSGPTRILCTNWSPPGGAAEGTVEHLERWLEARGLPAHTWRQQTAAESNRKTSSLPSKAWAGDKSRTDTRIEGL